VLPHAIAETSGAAPGAVVRIRRALGATDGNACGALFDLANSLGAQGPLRKLGSIEAALERETDIALHKLYWNPRSIGRKGMRNPLDAAFSGYRPEA
jgi:maleylacetate reductase